MHRDKYQSIFSCQVEATCLLFLPYFSQHVGVWESGNVTQTQPSFFWGIVSHMTCLGQSHANKHIWWVITRIIIHQIFLFKCNWSKYSWLNIPQQKLGNIQVPFPNFQNYVKNIWIINTTASIFHESMLTCLSFDIICSSKLTLFLKLHCWKTVRFSEQIMDKYPSMYFPIKWRLLFIIYSFCNDTFALIN